MWSKQFGTIKKLPKIMSWNHKCSIFNNSNLVLSSELSSTKTVFTKGNYKTVKGMDLGLSTIAQLESMKGSGLMIIGMAEAWSGTLTETNMKANSKTINLMAKEFTHGSTVRSTKESGNKD